MRRTNRRPFGRGPLVGNCLIGLALMAWRDRGRGRPLLFWDDIVPHFLWERSDHSVHHYRIHRDLLPWPFCYLLYRGIFSTAAAAEVPEVGVARPTAPRTPSPSEAPIAYEDLVRMCNATSLPLFSGPPGTEGPSTPST